MDRTSVEELSSSSDVSSRMKYNDLDLKMRILRS